MDRVEIIGDLYFTLKKNTVEISELLGVSKQYISKVLNCKYKTEFKEEKERRKNESLENRRKKKVNNIVEKRKNKDFYDISSEDLRVQHDMDIKQLSRGRTLSTQGAVFSSINAFNVKGNKLIYNEKVGARPADLPKSFSLQLNINVYR